MRSVALEGRLAAFAEGGDGLLIGRDLDTGKLLRYDGPAHLLTLAPTRAGKGVGTVIPNLLLSGRSMLVVDPKGENVRVAGAMRDAKLNPSDIGYINAHGTGTAANDKTECAAVVDAFGPDADNVMISSTKSMHGHIIGGTGAVELIAALMALREGVIPPTIGYEEPDPECSLDVVPNVAREARVDAVLSNAFAFGGLNAVLALTRAP